MDEAYAAHPERFVKGRPIALKAPDQVWINPPLPTSVSGVSPTEARLGEEATLTVGPVTSDNFEHSAVVEEMLWPASGEKQSSFFNGELSKNA